ncbi:unnamed protein product, partial [Prorocentrum cordatum]
RWEGVVAQNDKRCAAYWRKISGDGKARKGDKQVPAEKEEVEKTIAELQSKVGERRKKLQKSPDYFWTVFWFFGGYFSFFVENPPVWGTGPT